MQPTPTSAPRRQRISVNHPLTIDGTKVFLIGHGYAPHITVRDGKGNVAYSGATVFLPENEAFTSFGVVKAPDAEPKQIGLRGEFYPTYAFTPATGPFSAFPDAKNPAISMLAYSGDLGLDTGEAQSVYALDMKGLKPITKADGKPVRVDLALGKSQTLPDGLGTVTLRRRQPVRAAAGQREPGQQDRARRHGAGAHRAAGVAVHPAPADLAAGPARG